MNILTFDIEEWFHLLDFSDTKSETQWETYEIRIHENVDRILQLLDNTDSKATFFIIGWIAKKYPELVKKIAQKYEVGTHTMNHQLVWQQSRDIFKQDVESSIKLLEDTIGKKVNSFRAPGFSIRESEKWAFEVLYDLGISYDCSVFPAKHAHGGMTSVLKSEPCIIDCDGLKIKEFPIPVKSLMGQSIAYSGGGYFRLFPYKLIKKWADENPDYFMSYLHPRDLDYGQPVLQGLPLIRKFKSYVGIKGAENKLKKMLDDFTFVDVETANTMVNWAGVPIIKL